MIGLIFSILAVVVAAKDWRNEYNTLDYQKYGSKLDTNGDFMLDLEELRQIPAQLLNGHDVAQLLDRYDVNGDGVLSFAEFAAAGDDFSVRPISKEATVAEPTLLDTGSQTQTEQKQAHQHQQRIAALSRVHAHSTSNGNHVDSQVTDGDMASLSRVLAPKGDCCFRGEVAFNSRCYPVCKDGERLVAVQNKVYCADKDCPLHATCKTEPGGDGCSDVCVHCTKPCPLNKCKTEFCTANGQNGCWYQSDASADFSCDTGNVPNGVYYEQPIVQTVNMPSGDPRPCSQVYWNDDTLKPRDA